MPYLGAARIIIDQATLPPGVAGVSRDDGVIGQVVTLRNQDNTNISISAGGWRWVLYKPRTSAAVLSSPTSPSCTFTPDVDGTYRVTLEVNEGLKRSQKASAVLGVRSVGGFRYPAQGESTEANWTSAYTGNPNETGWWEDISDILRSGQAAIDGTHVTATAQPGLPNSRELVAGAGITITDGGPGSTIEIKTSATGGVVSLLDVPASPENLVGVRTVQAPTRDATKYGQVSLGSESIAGKGAKGNYAAVLGGLNNLASATGSTVVGGQVNTASAADAAVLGGNTNTASGARSGVVAGLSNAASGARAFIGAGQSHTATNDDSAVVAGNTNAATGVQSVVVGGNTNQAQGEGAFIGAGSGHVASGQNSGIVSGHTNSAIGTRAFVGGGRNHSAGGQGSAIAGGDTCTASGQEAFIGGGNTNTASGIRAAVAAGLQNGAAGLRSFIGAGTLNSATAEDAAIGGGASNSASAIYATVGGGATNTAAGSRSAIIGGGSNTIGANSDAVICGGNSNSTADDYTFVGGGLLNSSAGTYAFCGGGVSNNSSGIGSVVGGGSTNGASGNYSVVVGGASNTANGIYSSVLAGRSSTASASDAHVIGRNATAANAGAMVLKDGSASSETSSTTDQLTLRFDGGIRQICSGAKITRRLGTSANNYTETLQGQQSTTDGSAQTVNIATVPSGADCTVRGFLKGKQNSSANGRSLAFWATYTNNAGTVAIVGSAHVNDLKGAPAWSLAVGVSGTNIQLQFTGAVATTIRWTWEFEVHYGGQT